MSELQGLIERIIERININLRDPPFDVGPYLRGVVPLGQFTRFYAFYGLTQHHPLYFRFGHCSLAGSFFLGKCRSDYAVLYKSDIRGDELKAKGQVFPFEGRDIPLHDDEIIHIRDSYLIKTLVHNASHDPENLEEFLIQNTASMHYANIHGSTVEGCFLAPFSTVDLTTVHDCVIGAYAYVNTGELAHERVEPGTIRIRNGSTYAFSYQFPQGPLERYIVCRPGEKPAGALMDFVEDRKVDFEEVFDRVPSKPPIRVPAGAALSPYTVIKGKTRIGKNVLVAQRAYLEDAWLGDGANAQENCYVIRSQLEGNDVTAHGGNIVNAQLGKKVFVGFNAFLHGKPFSPLSIGAGTIIMPHTIIDLETPVQIPPGSLVWGLIQTEKDLEAHCIPLETLAQVRDRFSLGAMTFEGDGEAFVSGFRHRIEHILQANGAYFDGKKNRGHAQKDQDIVFNTIQPYRKGRLKGLYPTIEIQP